MISRFIYSVLFVFLFSSFQSEPKYSLTVEVKGFDSNTGNAFVALYREKDKFPEMNKQFKGLVVKISDLKATVKFADLPSGKYALAVFHDKNKNKELDKNLLGVPTESYGFSNGAREMFSAPSFNSAALEINKSYTTKVLVK